MKACRMHVRAFAVSCPLLVVIYVLQAARTYSSNLRRCLRQATNLPWNFTIMSDSGQPEPGAEAIAFMRKEEFVYARLAQVALAKSPLFD